MGRLSRYFDFQSDAWMKSLEAMVPEKFLDINRKAFEFDDVEHYPVKERA